MPSIAGLGGALLSASNDTRTASRKATPPAIGAGLILAVVAVVGTPLLDHSTFEAGFLDTLLRIDHALPLAGLGVALAIAGRRQLVSGLVLLACGIAGGAPLGKLLAPVIEENAEVAGYALLVGPIQCVAVGIALALPASLRSAALPAAAALSGIVLGLPIISDSGSGAQVAFTVGALVGDLVLSAIPVLLLRPFAGVKVAVAARIAGGWLIAIGLLLLAMELTRLRG